MREPTAKEIREFRKAANALSKLGKSGLTMYLSMDTLHLMRGPAHDDACKPQRQNIVESVLIPGADGGDW